MAVTGSELIDAINGSLGVSFNFDDRKGSLFTVITETTVEYHASQHSHPRTTIQWSVLLKKLSALSDNPTVYFQLISIQFDLLMSTFRMVCMHRKKARIADELLSIKRVVPPKEEEEDAKEKERPSKRQRVDEKGESSILAWDSPKIKARNCLQNESADVQREFTPIIERLCSLNGDHTPTTVRPVYGKGFVKLQHYDSVTYEELSAFVKWSPRSVNIEIDLNDHSFTVLFV